MRRFFHVIVSLRDMYTAKKVNSYYQSLDISSRRISLVNITPPPLHYHLVVLGLTEATPVGYINPKVYDYTQYFATLWLEKHELGRM